MFLNTGLQTNCPRWEHQYQCQYLEKTVCVTHSLCLFLYPWHFKTLKLSSKWVKMRRKGGSVETCLQSQVWLFVLFVYSFIMYCKQARFDSFMSGFWFIIGLKNQVPVELQMSWKVSTWLPETWILYPLCKSVKLGESSTQPLRLNFCFYVF